MVLFNNILKNVQRFCSLNSRKYEIETLQMYVHNVYIVLHCFHCITTYMHTISKHLQPICYLIFNK